MKTSAGARMAAGTRLSRGDAYRCPAFAANVVLVTFLSDSLKSVHAASGTVELLCAADWCHLHTGALLTEEYIISHLPFSFAVIPLCPTDGHAHASFSQHIIGVGDRLGGE